MAVMQPFQQLKQFEMVCRNVLREALLLLPPCRWMATLLIAVHFWTCLFTIMRALFRVAGGRDGLLRWTCCRAAKKTTILERLPPYACLEPAPLSR